MILYFDFCGFLKIFYCMTIICFNIFSCYTNDDGNCCGDDDDDNDGDDDGDDDDDVIYSYSHYVMYDCSCRQSQSPL